MKDESNPYIDTSDCYIGHKIEGLDELTKQLKRIADNLEKQNAKNN